MQNIQKNIFIVKLHIKSKRHLESNIKEKILYFLYNSMSNQCGNLDLLEKFNI